MHAEHHKCKTTVSYSCRVRRDHRVEQQVKLERFSGPRSGAPSRSTSWSSDLSQQVVATEGVRQRCLVSLVTMWRAGEWTSGPRRVRSPGWRLVIAQMRGSCSCKHGGEA